MAENEPTLPETHTSQPDVPRRRRWLTLIVFLLPLVGLLWVSNWFYQRSRLFTGSHVVLGEPTLPWGKILGDDTTRELFGVPVELNPYKESLSSYQVGLIGGYTPLKSLGLRGVTDSDIHRLSRLDNLTSLSLQDSPISDEACQVIGQLDKLTYLGITHHSSDPPEITAVGLEHLVGLKELSGLYLQSPELSDAGLKHIAQLQALEILALFDAKIHGDGLNELAQLPKLRSLQIQNSPLEGNCLSHLVDCTLLSSVWLNDSNVTDDMLDDLIPMTSLSHLYLRGTNVTPAGCQRFHRARPNVRLYDVQDDLVE